MTNWQVGDVIFYKIIINGRYHTYIGLLVDIVNDDYPHTVLWSGTGRPPTKRPSGDDLRLYNQADLVKVGSIDLTTETVKEVYS